MANAMNANWTADRIPAQDGRRVVITGANSGIGYEAALELARRGAEVVLPARTEAKAEGAAKRIRAEVPGAKVVTAALDLASLKSVRAFAGWYAERFDEESLDLLINNAGVMAVPTRELTEDGYERQFATNCLGPFALTGLLFPHLKRRAGTRVVTVASSVSNQGKIEFDNLQSERKYSPMWGAYAQSKLADLVFQQELQRRLTKAGSPILSTGGHPGYAITSLQTSGPGESLPLVMRIGMTVLKPIASQDAAMGALPTLYAAAAEEAGPGSYVGPSGFQELKGYPVAAKICAAAKDEALGKKLWEVTERLTGVTFDVAAVVKGRNVVGVR